MTVRAAQLQLGSTLPLFLSRMCPCVSVDTHETNGSKKTLPSSATCPRSAEWKSDPIKFCGKQNRRIFPSSFSLSRQHRSAGLTVSSVEYFGALAQPLVLFLCCLEIPSQRDANLPTSFLPPLPPRPSPICKHR